MGHAVDELLDAVLDRPVTPVGHVLIGRVFVRIDHGAVFGGGVDEGLERGPVGECAWPRYHASAFPVPDAYDSHLAHNASQH